MMQVSLDSLVAEVAEFGNKHDKRLMREALKHFGFSLREVCESPWLLPREGENDFAAISERCFAAGSNYLQRK